MAEQRDTLVETEDFVRSQLPPPPARVLEVGCGDGRLAQALAAAGYSVTAIDPRAPSGAIFRQVTLEAFDSEERFDAAVAIVCLHHIADVGAAVGKIASLLTPRGRLIVEEFAKERFVERSTAEWYWSQRNVGNDFERWLRDWIEDHADVHEFATIDPQLERQFVRRDFTRVPYLHLYDLDPAVEPVERALIARGEIEATGIRYVGERRGRPPRSAMRSVGRCVGRSSRARMPRTGSGAVTGEPARPFAQWARDHADGFR
jgi:SAM-dependent methyltransferase